MMRAHTRPLELRPCARLTNMKPNKCISLARARELSCKCAFNKNNINASLSQDLLWWWGKTRRARPRRRQREQAKHIFPERAAAVVGHCAVNASAQIILIFVGGNNKRRIKNGTNVRAISGLYICASKHIHTQQTKRINNNITPLTDLMNYEFFF